MGRLSFSIDPVPPFRLDLTAWAIRRRPENAVDQWNGQVYERVLAIRGKPVLTTVAQSGTWNAPRLEVTASAAHLPNTARIAVTAALERLLGLQVDLTPFYRLAAEHGRLHELASRFRGLKPPRFPTVWEGLVNGIACQQFSLAVGILMLNRLAALCGQPLGGDATRHAFPTPEDLATAAPESLRSLGLNGAKSRQLIGLAKQSASGPLDLESYANLTNEKAISRLLELPGVGRWTAEYVLLRGMGRIDAFPGDDVGARNNLARWLRLRKPLDYSRVMRVIGKWKPYGGLIYFHLLLDGLERAGYLRPGAEGGSRARSNHMTEPARAGSTAGGTDFGGLDMIKLKRVYEEDGPDEGVRYLIERLWPRGVKKASLRIDGWLKDAGPSTELRKWFSHDPEKWQEFRRRYFAELDRAPDAWAPIREALQGTVTLLYSSHDTEHNNAIALKEYIEHKAGAGTHAASGRPRH